MAWIASTGGPLVIIGKDSVGMWHGSSPSASETDYDRACEVVDYLGVVDVGEESAIVLGDEPMQTTWIDKYKGKGGLIIRWIYANDESELMKFAQRIPESAFAKSSLIEECQIHISGGKYWMFDSAMDGSELESGEILEIDLAGGKYVVETIEYDPNPETSMIVSRLQLSSKA